MPELPIDRAGIYDIPLARYIADPCPAPSLSGSIANVLLMLSPRHAWEQHPRLNPEYASRQGNHLDLGTVAHRELLGKGEEIVVIDCAEYRKQQHKDERDAAYAAGKTPIKAPDYEEVCRMVEAARAQLAAHEIGDVLLQEGWAEQTLVWREHGVWCRACIDWMLSGGATLYNYKTTTCAHPDVWTRRAYQLGYDLSAAFHAQGIAALTGASDIVHRWVVQERKPPYALSVIELSPAAITMAERKVGEALSLWRKCLEAGVWPAYPPQVLFITPPGYAAMEWERRELEGHYEVYHQLIEGYAR